MKFQKKNNPNSPEYSLQLQVLNEFLSFITNLDEKKSVKFKQDAIKIVECLKFIKINLNFIGFAITHKKDNRVYTYSSDKRKGLLRDFNNTAMHFNAYHSPEFAQAALATLVQQFESTIQTMRDRKELESFASQLEYDKAIGCIELSTAKGFTLAAKHLSSPLSYALDDLIGQCGLVKDENSITALAKANDFLQPYLGLSCIWENNDYIL